MVISKCNPIKLDYSTEYLASYRSSRSTLYLIEVIKMMSHNNALPNRIPNLNFRVYGCASIADLQNPKPGYSHYRIGNGNFLQKIHKI